jgi:hypothetical protein
MQKEPECTFLNFAWLVRYLGLNGETYRALVRNTFMNLNPKLLWESIRTLTGKGVVFDRNWSKMTTLTPQTGRSTIKGQNFAVYQRWEDGQQRLSIALEKESLRWETHYIYILPFGRLDDLKDIDQMTFFKMYQTRLAELFEE